MCERHATVASAVTTHKNFPGVFQMQPHLETTRLHISCNTMHRETRSRNFVSLGCEARCWISQHTIRPAKLVVPTGFEPVSLAREASRLNPLADRTKTLRRLFFDKGSGLTS